MALFLGLYLGHILGDFVFQPGRLVIAKRERLSAAVAHSAIVMLCGALALAGAIAQAWVAVLASGLVHLAVEQLSIGARRNPGATGLTVFLLDQGLHLVSLAVIAMILGTTGPYVLAVWEVSVTTLATVCALATVAFGGSILVFEVQAASVWQQADATVLGLDFSRLYGMAERAGALVLALVMPLPALGALAFAPRLAYTLTRERERRAHHLPAAAIGLALTAAGWLFVTLVPGTAR
ncbi:MAG: DUF3307 domain-containing protein [Coriobacteriia bacterium]